MRFAKTIALTFGYLALSGGPQRAAAEPESGAAIFERCWRSMQCTPIHTLGHRWRASRRDPTPADAPPYFPDFDTEPGYEAYQWLLHMNSGLGACFKSKAKSVAVMLSRHKPSAFYSTAVIEPQNATTRRVRTDGRASHDRLRRRGA